MSVDDRKQLEDSKPRRERFPDQEPFEEALGYWMSHQGRILAMTRRTDGAPGRDWRLSQEGARRREVKARQG